MKIDIPGKQQRVLKVAVSFSFVTSSQSHLKTSGRC